MKVPYNKLVRDRIPEIIRADGHQPVTRILDQAGHRSALVANLLEEAQEASTAPATDLPPELADVLEVMQEQPAVQVPCGVTLGVVGELVVICPPGDNLPPGQPGLKRSPCPRPLRRLRYQRTSVPDGKSSTQPTSS